MWRRRAELESLDIHVLLVSFEPVHRVRLYQSADGPRWPVLSDESRTGYERYGLERASFLRTWFSPRTTLFYVRAALRGKRLRRPVSDTRQLGGDFLIDPEGRVVFAFRSAEPADRPSADLIIRARTGHDRFDPGQ